MNFKLNVEQEHRMKKVGDTKHLLNSTYLKRYALSEAKLSLFEMQWPIERGIIAYRVV